MQIKVAVPPQTRAETPLFFEAIKKSLLPYRHAPEFQNGVTEYGAGCELVRAIQISNMVHITGRIVLPAGFTSGATVFTLPSGWRPNTTVTRGCVAPDGVKQVDVDTSGNVIVFHAGALAWLALDLMYLAEK